jgi:hypothetical protein
MNTIRTPARDWLCSARFLIWRMHTQASLGNFQWASSYHQQMELREERERGADAHAHWMLQGCGWMIEVYTGGVIQRDGQST